MIQKKPIFIDFDRRREIVFNLNTEILIRGAGKAGQSLWDTIGVETDPITGEEKRSLDVNLENLRTYLWAALQADARRHDEILTEDEVGTLLVKRRWVTQAVVKIAEALSQYYGDTPGED